MQSNPEDTLNDLAARLGKVRRWLLALGALRTAAIWIVALSLYVGAYALADHRQHFGRTGRVAALAGLVALLAILLYHLIKTWRRDMSYTRAASHVEARHSFDQQLVAAAEYYEQGQDYPYSKRLARQLVQQAGQACHGFDFDSTVDKRQGYVLAGGVALGLAIVSLFVYHNIRYLTSYVARLVSPLAAIEPVSATLLKPLTADIVTPPNVPVTVAAAIEGRPPESAVLVLSRDEPNESPRRLEVVPAEDANGAVTLSTTVSLEKIGDVTYRFEAGSVSSDTHTITVAPVPGIEQIVALVQAGRNIPPYSQKVAGNGLEVLPGSLVELQVKATTPLREATIGGAEDKPLVQKLDGAEDFRVQFKVDKPLSISFHLVSTKGLSNTEPLTMRVTLRSDAPPQFKLLSPDGDCLATDVASIPMVFEVTDDFGLDRAQLCCEMPGGATVVLDSNSPQGAKQAHLSAVLELERYDLNVGDSLLFYAKARDVVTGYRQGDPNTCSEIYFIEIRSYRQYWHPQPSGGPSSQPGRASEDLITILEYTRAIVKKTWSLAQAPPAEKRPEELAKLRSDTEYTSKRLAGLRDDPDSHFTGDQKAALTRVTEQYDSVTASLAANDANKASGPAREAYRLLRNFIDELHLKWNPPESGQSVPEEKPQRVRLQEQPNSSAQDQERAEGQLEKAQNQIDSLAQQERALKADLAKAMQKQNPQAGGQKSENGGQKGQSDSAGQEGSRGSSSGQNGSSGGKGQGGQPSQANASTQQAASNPANDQRQSGTDSQQAQSSAAKQRSQGGASGQQGSQPINSSRGSISGPKSETAEATSNPQSAIRNPQSSSDALLRMLQARQNALRQQASQLSAELAQIALPSSSGRSATRDTAKQQLDKAAEDMKRLEDKLADARYSPTTGDRQQSSMADMAESAVRELSEAGQAIRRGLSGDKQLADAQKAEAMARQLAKDAEALDRSLSPEERQQMLDRLNEAERLLESMTKPQWQTVAGGGGGAAGLVYTRGSSSGPSETARMLSRQFWSVALQAKDRRMNATEDEPSDVQYFERENEFYENAAKFKPQQSQK